MKVTNFSIILQRLSQVYVKRLDHVMFFITSKCNLRCEYCFNKEELGGKNDLEFSEIKKIFNHFDNLVGLGLSGGEPFYRDDFLKIMNYFIKERGMKSFGIPTNCIDTKRTIENVEKLAKFHPEASFVICCSLDPSEKIHNRFRGNGAYQRVVKTIKELSRLKEKYSNLQTLVNSVVTKDAVSSLDKFSDFVYQELKPTLHSLDIVRTKNEKERKDFAGFNQNDYLQILNNRLKMDGLYRKDDILLPLYKTRTKILTEAQRKCITKEGRWPSSCLAGITSFVIQHDGNISVCENRPPLGNLRDYNYDYKKILNEKLTPSMMAEIKSHKCDCNHIVYLRESIESDFPKIVLKNIFSDWEKLSYGK